MNNYQALMGRKLPKSLIHRVEWVVLYDQIYAKILKPEGVNQRMMF